METSNMQQMGADLQHYTRRRENLLASRTLRLRRLVDLYTNPFLSEFADPYKVLAELLEEFGKLYLLPAIKNLFPPGYRPVRTVDWGAGTGWLGHSLATGSCVFVDKRPGLLKYQGTAVNLDIEKISDSTSAEIADLTGHERELSILSEVLHCLTVGAATQLLSSIESPYLLVIEQVPEDTRMSAVAEQQIAMASGQQLLTVQEVRALLENNGWAIEDQVHLYHYVIWKAVLK